MIIEIRNIMYKKNLYKVFLWAFLLMFIGGGIGVGLFQRANNPDAITVHGHSVSRERFYKALRSAEKQKEYYRANGVDLGGDVKSETVQMLVNRYLEKEILNQLGVHADNFNLKQALDDQLSFLPKYFFDESGNLDEAMFRKHVGSDPQDLFEEIKQSAESEILYGILGLSQYVSQFEINAQYNKEYADKTVEVFTLSSSDYSEEAKKKKVSDKELASFYKKMTGKDRFKTAEKRAGEYWVFDKSSYEVTVSDKEVKKQYNKDKIAKYLEAPAEVQVRRILLKSTDANSAEVKERAQGLRAELVDEPAKFAEIAKKTSEDEYASKGGLLPFFAKNSKAFDSLIVKKSFEFLSKDGQISQVIKVDGGYAILQRVSRKKAKYTPLSSVKAEIKKGLLKSKYENRFMQAARRMTSQVKYKPELLQAFIDKHNGVQHEISLSARAAGSVASSKLFITGVDRYQVYFDEKNNGVIMHCTEMEAAKLKDLGLVRDKIEEFYYQSEAKKLMQKDVDAVMNQAATQSLEEISQIYKGKYERGSSSFKNGQRSEEGALRLHAIQQKLDLLQYPGDLVEVVMPHGTAVLKLDQLADKDEELYAAKRADMQQTLHFAEKHKKRQSFIASLGRNAILNKVIEIKEEFKPQ